MLFIEFLRLLVFLLQIALQVVVLCAKATAWVILNIVVPGLAALWAALERGTARAAAWWNEQPLEDPLITAAAQRRVAQPAITASPAGSRSGPPRRPVMATQEPSYIQELRAQGLYPYYVLNGERSGWWVENRQLWPDSLEVFRADGYYVFYTVDGAASGWTVGRSAPWLDAESLRAPAQPFTPTPDSRPV